jgi:hypothetical protein
MQFAVMATQIVSATALVCDARSLVHRDGKWLPVRASPHGKSLEVAANRAMLKMLCDVSC